MSPSKKVTSPEDELDRKIAESVQIGLPIVIVSLVILAGVFVDAPTALLVAAAGALIAVIAVFWSSLRTLLGETPLSTADAYVFGATPHVEEEQKRSVLRALKDIEFERSVGKISEEDYAQLAAKYREEAKRLLQTIDEKSALGRERAEALVEKKLRQVGLAEAKAETNDDEDETNDEDETDKSERDDDVADKPIDDAVDAPSTESAVSAVEMVLATKRPVKKKKKKARAKPAFEVDKTATDNACGKCGTTNDKDAVFCKKCGTRVGKPEEASDEAETASQNVTDETEDES
jgi:chemotaxis protein histidine kinase CheA